MSSSNNISIDPINSMIGSITEQSMIHMSRSQLEDDKSYNSTGFINAMDDEEVYTDYFIEELKYDTDSDNDYTLLDRYGCDDIYHSKCEGSETLSNGSLDEKDICHMSDEETEPCDDNMLYISLHEIEKRENNVISSLPMIIFQFNDLIDEKNVGFIFMCRIWVSEIEKYRYAVEFSKKIEKNIRGIDNRYACEWKVELLTVMHARDQDCEILLRYELLNLGFRVNNYTYAINENMYIYMKERSIYSNPFYEFINGEETYLGTKVSDSEYTSASFN